MQNEYDFSKAERGKFYKKGAQYCRGIACQPDSLGFSSFRGLTTYSLLHIMWHMKTATVRQIRHDFGSVLKMIEDGEEVTITRRNKPVARLAPPPPATLKPLKWPDFASRLAVRFPQGILAVRPLAERISEERDRY